jgi:hypothetical protein
MKEGSIRNTPLTCARRVSHAVLPVTHIRASVVVPLHTAAGGQRVRYVNFSGKRKGKVEKGKGDEDEARLKVRIDSVTRGVGEVPLSIPWIPQHRYDITQDTYPHTRNTRRIGCEQTPTRGSSHRKLRNLSLFFALRPLARRLDASCCAFWH